MLTKDSPFMLNHNLETDTRFRDYVMSNAFAVIFQANTLRYIRQCFYLSKTDFAVLSAGYLIQRTSVYNQFSSGEVRRFVVGIYRNEVYKAVRRLSKQGYIQQGVSSSKRKRYALTQKGIDCISSYTDFLSKTIEKFQRDNPGYWVVFL